MATVKSIDVALRANTTEFEAGMRSGISTIKKFSDQTDRIAAQMSKATQLFNSGAIGTAEFSKTIQDCDREITALNHGFQGMGDATQRAKSILLGMETETDKYNRKLDELNRLKKVGALSEGEHARAVAHTTAEFNKSIPAVVKAQSALSRLTSTIAPFIIAGGAAAVAHRAMSIASNTARSAYHKLAQSMENVDSAHKAATSIGIATGELLKLRFAINEVTGIGIEGVDAVLKKMNLEIAEAASTGKGATAAIESLGLSVSKLSQMTPDKAFFTLAEAIASVKGAGDKAIATQAIFGRQGSDLLPLFQDSASALKEASDFAQRFGFNLSQVKSTAISQALDSLQRMRSSLEGMAITIAGSLAEPLEALSSSMINRLEAGSNAVSTLDTNFENMGRTIAAIADVVDPLIRGLILLQNISGNIVTNFNDAKKALGLGIKTVTGEKVPVTGAKAPQMEVEPTSFVDRYDKALADIRKRNAETAAKFKPPSIVSEKPKLNTPKTPDIFDTSKVSAYGKVIETAAQRQKEILDNFRESNRSFREGIMGSLKIKQPEILKMQIDMNPLQTFEDKVARLRQYFSMDPYRFGAAFSQANVELQRGLGLLDEFQKAQEQLRTKQLDTLQSVTQKQEEMWSKNNPMLAFQKEMSEKVSHLNGLYKAGSITLAKRNELIAFEASVTRSAAVEAQEELNKKIKEVNEAFQAGLLPLAERNRLLAMPAEIESSKVFDEASKKLEDMKSRSASITEAMRTPLEKFAEKIAEIRQLEKLGVKAGGIDRTTAMRAEMDARKQALDEMKDKAKEFLIPQVKGPAAVERGTQAFSAFQENKRNFENRNEELALQKKIEAHLASIARGGVILTKAKGI